MANRHYSSWRLGALLGLVAGCTGAIGTTSTVGVGAQATTGTASGPGATVGGTAASMVSGPGRVTMRRLNQTEYDNTVRDLLGTSQQPALIFESDSQSAGFDNNGDLLSLSPVRMDQYRQAAASLATEALAPPRRATILTCDPTTGDACISAFVTSFGERAYRRPLAADEVASYLSLAATARTAGGTPDDVVSTILQAILVSPNFLFHVELDPNPTSATPHPLSTFELASRLSYMIYASMPDAALYASAKSGRLSDPSEIQAQLSRMLVDPKGLFAQNFSEQWLGVRSVDTSQPDAVLFPTFNAALGQSMKQEVDLVFDEFVRTNLPLDSLLTTTFTYVDDRLAMHYGMPSVGAAMTRVDLTSNPQRGGLLTMAALLTATSRGNRTSPVSRGRWTLSELLCSDPPPPPPDVVIPSEDVIDASSARDFLAQHRQNATCAACHNLMDPIGLALENYDAIGAWRTMDHGEVIDASGNMPDGTKFNGAHELEQVVANDPRYQPCVAGAVLTYALGRTLRPADQTYVNALSRASGSTAVGLRDVLTRIVVSDPFQQRQGEPVAMGGN